MIEIQRRNHQMGFQRGGQKAKQYCILSPCPARAEQTGFTIGLQFFFSPRRSEPTGMLTRLRRWSLAPNSGPHAACHWFRQRILG